MILNYSKNTFGLEGALEGLENNFEQAVGLAMKKPSDGRINLLRMTFERLDEYRETLEAGR